MSIITPARPLPRASTVCRQCLSYLRRQSTSTNHDREANPNRRYPATSPPRSISNASSQKSNDNAQSLPRWMATPAAMKAPFKARPANDNDDFPVNENPALLDDMYARFIGKDSPNWIDEHVKWLAVTHKSFDHGRRGNNERLAFLGKRMMGLQTSYALLDKGAGNEKLRIHTKRKDAYGRSPFMDPALEGIQNVNIFQKEQILDERRLAQLGERLGLQDVVRWKPRQIRDLRTSGIDGVITTAMYAIVGAVALQRGGEIANQTIKQRILSPLGIV